MLIDETPLNTKDFLSADGRYYFVLAKQIRNKGFTSFDEVTVLSSLSENAVEVFNERGGWEVVQNLIDVINDKNWETYIDILYRENILIGMFNDGFNLLKEIYINNKKVIPLDFFRTLSSEEVLEWYEARLTTYGTGYSNKILEEEIIEFDDEYLKKCSEGELAGCPFDIAGNDINGESMNCLPFLSRQIDGFAESTFNLIAGYSSVGKSSLLVTIIMGLLYRGKKVLIISNEQSVAPFKNSFIIWVLGKYFRYFNLTKKKMKNGNISDEDSEMLKKAFIYWKKNIGDRVKFIRIDDANTSLVKKKIRENVLRYGYDTVIYDTMKMEIMAGDKNPERFSLIRDSREFDKIAKKYNVIFIATLQTAIWTTGVLFLTASVLSEAKAVKEICESLLIMRVAYAEELDPENKKYYCRPFRLKRVNDKWVQEEYTPDRTAIYRVLFPNKTRSGENSDDNGQAFLLKFDGSHSIFREVAFCYPKHGKIE